MSIFNINTKAYAFLCTPLYCVLFLPVFSPGFGADEGPGPEVLQHHSGSDGWQAEPLHPGAHY